MSEVVVQASGEVEIMECPECKGKIPVNKGYVSWCDSCGWNLKAEKQEQVNNISELIDVKLGGKLSMELFERMKRAEKLEVKVTPTMLVAYVLSAIIHSLSIITAVLGVWMFLSFGKSILGIFGGVVLLLVAYELVPKPSKVPKGILPREGFVELYRFVDEIGEKLGLGKIDGIIIIDEFNAFFTQAGIGRKKIVAIGLPYFEIMSRQEKTALLAHEVAHGVNGDIRRRYLVHTAINALNSWYYLIHPESLWNEELGIFGLILLPFNIIGLLISKLIYLMELLLKRLTWKDSQRAEYLADYYAASLSGTDAKVEALGKSYYYDIFRHTVASSALGQSSKPLFQTLRENIKNIPEREIERIRRVNILQNTRLDVTHPPTAYRVEFLRNHSVEVPKFELGEERMKLINRELSGIRREIEERIIDTYKYYIS